MNIVIATIKSWNIENAKEFARSYEKEHTITIITEKEELVGSKLEEINPDYLFFLHWSYIIPKEIYENYNCVVFHMTNLPFGRGGSPLQNLIVRGYTETVISAIKVTEGLDAGPVYFKTPLSLNGSASEIFKRSSNLIFKKMIPQFLMGELEPKEQEGEVVTFKRRKPSESELKPDFTLKEIYDHIRMLDAEGYPNAFLEFGDYRLEFSNGKMDGDSVGASVIIKKAEKNE